MRSAILLLVVLMGAAPASAPVASNPFATFGAVVTQPPEPWHRFLEGGTGHIARWAHRGSDGKNDAIMTLELEPARNRSAEQYAGELAKRLKGVAKQDAARLGGEPAYRVVGERQPNVPTEGLVARHGDHIYVVSGFADTAEKLPASAVNAMATSLKFIPIPDPSAVTDLRGESFPLFGKLVLAPMETMRPNPAPADEGQVAVGTIDFRTNKPAVLMNIQLLPNPQGKTLEEFQTVFPGKLNPNAKVTWMPMGTSPASVLSSTFPAIDDRGGSMKTRIAMVLVPPDNDVAFILFNYLSDDAKAVSAYERASEAIVKSVQPLRK